MVFTWTDRPWLKTRAMSEKHLTIIMTIQMKQTSGLTLGGTSLVIVTGVTLEIYRKIKTEMTRFDYKKQSFFWRQEIDL